MDPTGPTARRFPLIARPRPACIPLDTRVDALCALARSAEQDGNQASASAVHNQAALLASDIGLPKLAREWCHRHAAAYLRAHPLGAQAARHALEPLVNLARLHIRDWKSDAAFQLLDALYKAVTSRIDTVIDGLLVPAATLTATADDHRELCQWLWTVHMADGARALTSAGRWHDAHTHLQRHNGIGRRIFDGRKVAIIAVATEDDADGALTLLNTTAPGEPWENAVTACLTLLCLSSVARPADSAFAAAVEHYIGLEPAPELLVFRTRLGLTLLDLAGDVEQCDAAQAATRLVNEAVAAGDGYAARDVLTHDECRARLTRAEEEALSAAVRSSGLGCGAIPPHLTSDLLAAVKMSETVTARTLATPMPASSPI